MHLVMAACGHAALRPQRPGECLAPGGGRADVGIGPYERTEGGARRGGFYIRPSMPAISAGPQVPAVR